MYPGGQYRESKGFVALMFSCIGGAEDEEQKGADASIHVSIRDKFGEEVHEGSCWVCQEQNKKESLSGKMGHLADMKLIRDSKIIENTAFVWIYASKLQFQTINFTSHTILFLVI